MNNLTYWKNGLKDGIPRHWVILPYHLALVLPGTMASALFRQYLCQQPLYICRTIAALGLIANSAGYIKMAVAQLIINLRYFLMSCSLSQKIDTDKAFS